ncbi:MAG: hypothetical protein U0871_12105 [Gemmataceae bacterium]
MGFTYTTANVVEWLKADMTSSGTWPWVIDRLRNSGHTFEVTNMHPSKPFTGYAKTAYVGNTARDQIEATNWAKEALREWAGAGVEEAGNYFPLIARDYAINGPGKGHTAKSLGTTLDFITLLAKFGSSWANGNMLETNAVLGKDVPEVFCFAYTGVYSPTGRFWAKVGLGDADNEKAPIEGTGGDGPNGLNEQFFDSNGKGYDQTHHFAAFFCHGASHGLHESEMEVALSATGDWSIVHRKVTNQGDYDLGWLGAKWGASFKGRPRLIGKEVEAALLAGDKDLRAKVPDPKA